MSKTNQQICTTCGKPASPHPYRHPITYGEVQTHGEPEPKAEPGLLAMVQAATGMQGATELECLRAYWKEHEFPHYNPDTEPGEFCSVCFHTDPFHSDTCPRLPYLKHLEGLSE